MSNDQDPVKEAVRSRAQHATVCSSCSTCEIQDVVRAMENVLDLEPPEPETDTEDERTWLEGFAAALQQVREAAAEQLLVDIP